MLRKWLIWIFVDSSFAVEGRVESVFGPFHTEEVSQSKDAVVASTSRPDMYSDSRSSCFDNCRWGSLALVRAVHSRPAVVRE